MAQQLGGRHRGQVRVHALVDAAVDTHEAAAGGSRELPQAGGAYPRARLGIERRLHVGQGHQPHGQTHVGEDLPNVGLPDARAGEPRLELIRLPELEAQATGGSPKALVAHALGPQRQHTGLIVAEIVALARGEREENVLVALLGGLHQPALGPRPGAFGESQHLVHDTQMAAVVDQSAAGIHLRVHPGPEEDVRLERRRSGEAARRLGHGSRAPQQACNGNKENALGGHGLCEPFSSWQSFPWARFQLRHAASKWPRLPVFIDQEPARPESNNRIRRQYPIRVFTGAEN